MRFIVATDSASTTNDIRNAVTAFLEGKGWSVWHWFQDLWLVANAPESTRLVILRDEIVRAVPGLKTVMIMSTEGIKEHGGLVPSDSVAWIEEHWKNR